MLIDLTIRTWNARKYDKKVSLQVLEQNNAASDAGRFNKHLLPGQASSYEAVHKKARELRAFFYEQTLPWSKDGQRILPTSNYLKFTEEFRKLQKEFDIQIDNFLRSYPLLKEDAKHLLGIMYNELDYPTTSEMKLKFGAEIEVLPLPSGDDFRVGLNDEEVSKIRKEIEERIQREIKNANKDLWGRLRELVDNMIQRLDHPNPRLHTSMIGNLRDLIDLIPRLNVTDDQNLEEIRKKCEAQLASYDIHELRDNPVARMRASERAKEISSMMDAYM